jgi:hypothetical protein
MWLFLPACRLSAPAGAPPELSGRTDATLSADLTYTSSRDGTLVCDLDLSVSGEGTTECPSCDFHFWVTPTVTRDDSPGWCHPEPGLTWLVPDLQYGRLDWDASTARLTSYYAAGYEDDYGFWDYSDETVIACPHCENAAASVSDSGVTWETNATKSVTSRDSLFWPYGCEAYGAATSASFEGADATGAGSVAAGAWQVDVWALDGASGRVEVALDTTDEATAAQLQLFVVDPTRCLLVAVPESRGVDPALSAPCSFGALSCPSVGFNSTPGTWYLGVRSPDARAEPTGYTIRVVADGAPALTLRDDDVDSGATSHHTDVVSSNASGRFTPGP